MIQTSADLPVNGSKPSAIKMIIGKQIPVLLTILAVQENHFEVYTLHISLLSHDLYRRVDSALGVLQAFR